MKGAIRIQGNGAKSNATKKILVGEEGFSPSGSIDELNDMEGEKHRRRQWGRNQAEMR